ncbi:MAG: glycosyltransferase, partial [Actinomycetota bacterium]|nr:glycosyltransferase [Actinomycetota bacterium]
REVVCFTDSEGFGGAERALLMLLDGLDARNWRATLCHHPAPGVEPLVAQARQLGISTWSVPPLPHGLLGMLRIPSFARALRERRPAVFHAHLTWPLGAKNGLLAALAARVPAVLVTVQLYMDVPVTRGMLLQQRLIGAGVDRFLPVSRHNARRLEALLHWPRRKMEVVHNAIDPAPFARPPDPALRRALADERPLVLVVARLDPQKGHRHLLAAAAEVPDAIFALAGDGPERLALEELADRLGIRDRVRFLGERSDVADLLAACDVFVLPSLYEGLPISVLEAMAADRPVLATAIGGTNEVVIDGESGLLVPPAKPEAMAAALRRLLDDPALRSRLAAAGLARVTTEFSASQMVRRVTELYELLSQPRGRMSRPEVR